MVNARTRPLDLATVVNEIVTGHLQSAAGYATQRPKGTTDWLLMLTLDGRGRGGIPRW